MTGVEGDSRLKVFGWPFWGAGSGTASASGSGGTGATGLMTRRAAISGGNSVWFILPTRFQASAPACKATEISKIDQKRRSTVGGVYSMQRCIAQCLLFGRREQMPTRTAILACGYRQVGKFRRQRAGQNFIHVQTGPCRFPHAVLQPHQPGAGLTDRRRIAKNLAMAGNEGGKAGFTSHRFQFFEGNQPLSHVGMRRRWRPAIEYQIARKQSAGRLIIDSQIGPGMSAKADQTQLAAGNLDRAGIQGACWRDHLGPFHPLSRQAKQILGKSVSICRNTLAGSRKSPDRRIGKRLVTKEMIGMMMRVDGQGNRLATGNSRHGAAHLLAIAQRRTGVDDDDTLSGNNESGIDDIATIGHGEILCPSNKGVDILGYFSCHQTVIEFGGRRGNRKRQEDGGQDSLHGAILARKVLPLLSRPLASTPALPPTPKLSVKTGFSATGRSE